MATRDLVEARPPGIYLGPGLRGPIEMGGGSTVGQIVQNNSTLFESLKVMEKNTRVRQE